VIPKFHGAKLTDIPDEDLLEILVSETPPERFICRGEDIENVSVESVEGAR
jgi:hypothetical protein